MYLILTVVPGSKKELVTHTGDHSLTVCVREKNERGEANKRVLAIIREMYPFCVVTMVKGHHAHKKIIDVTNVS